MAVSVETEAERALPAPASQKQLPAEVSVEPTGVERRSSVGSWLRRLALVLIVLGAAALGYWKYTGNQKEQVAVADRTTAAANRPIPVTVTAVGSRTMPIYVTALGTVTAYNTVTVKSRVDGQLLSVNVREGQGVKQGQVLATIDSRPYEATVAQAEGQLLKDQAAADLARTEAGRYTALYQAGVVSKESEQTQQSSAGASAGTLAADRAAIQAAKVNVAYARITSPINGVVGLRQLDAGNIVHAADATGLLVVTQLQPIAVIFTLPEVQLPEVLKRIRAGQKLVVEAYDASEATRLASGTLVTLDNEIDTTTGTVKAKAVFNNADGALFPNQFVNVRMILEERQNSLVIPASGLQNGQGGTFVYVVKPCAAAGCPKAEGGGDAAAAGGKKNAARGAGDAGKGEDGEDQEKAKGPRYYVESQPVVVDLTEGSQVILKGGVNAGDQIVIDGQEKLKKNSRVVPKAGGAGSGTGRAGEGSPADAGANRTGAARGESRAPGERSGGQSGDAGTRQSTDGDGSQRVRTRRDAPARQP